MGKAHAYIVDCPAVTRENANLHSATYTVRSLILLEIMLQVKDFFSQKRKKISRRQHLLQLPNPFRAERAVGILTLGGWKEGTRSEKQIYKILSIFTHERQLNACLQQFQWDSVACSKLGLRSVLKN